MDFINPPKLKDQQSRLGRRRGPLRSAWKSPAWVLFQQAVNHGRKGVGDFRVELAHRVVRVVTSSLKHGHRPIGPKRRISRDLSKAAVCADMMNSIRATELQTELRNYAIYDDTD